jgi:hypothetical protein
VCLAAPVVHTPDIRVFPQIFMIPVGPRALHCCGQTFLAAVLVGPCDQKSSTCVFRRER